MYKVHGYVYIVQYTERNKAHYVFIAYVYRRFFYYYYYYYCNKKFVNNNDTGERV